MKILFVGYRNPHFMSLCEYVQKALRSLGHEVFFYDYRAWIIPGRLRERMTSLHEWDLKRINQKLVKKAQALKPDIVLITGGWTIHAESIQIIKETTAAITVNWIADFPLLFQTYLEVGPSYDFFFTSGTDALALYQSHGHQNGYWLPFGCDTEEHKPVKLTAEDYERYQCDISFVGSYYEQRAKDLEKLADLNIGIWGPGWEKLPHGSPLSPKIRGGSLTSDEWVKVYSASQISLNIISHINDGQTPMPKASDFRLANTKVFEILACQTLQVVTSNADVMALFNDHEHLLMFGNMTDCRRLITYYLDYPDEAEHMIINGYNEVITNHTYQKRLQEMLRLISEKTSHQTL